MDDYLGFIEFFVVAMFAAAWAILEWQGRRLDRRRDAERAATASPADPTTVAAPGSTPHPEELRLRRVSKDGK